MSQVVYIELSNLIPGYPSRFLIIISLLRGKRSVESTHPCLTPHLIFLNELIFPLIRIAAVCSQCKFLITCRIFHLSLSLSNNCVIPLLCCTQLNALQSLKQTYTSYCTSRTCSVIVQRFDISSYFFRGTNESSPLLNGHF